MSTNGRKVECRWCHYRYYPQTEYPLECPNKKCQKPYPLGFPPLEIAELQGQNPGKAKL